MRKTNVLPAILSLCAILALVGCQEKTKDIVLDGYTVLGESLLGAKVSVDESYDNEEISESTYNQIRTNWLRARDIYTETTPLVIDYAKDEGYNLSDIYEAMTQLRIIIADIEAWINE